MLIDLHAHSSGISRCCKIPYCQVLAQALDFGMNGIVLTNHYQESYMRGNDADDLAERYIEEFYKTQRYGEEIGCKVFFGIEVTPVWHPDVHLLVYGVGPEFLRTHPRLFDYSLEELYRLVKDHRGVLVQAHPFRNGTTVMDTAYLDGVEINCHPLYGKSYSQELLEIAKEKKLLVTCGGDYHADTYRPKCGMFLPDDLADHNDFRDYLLSPEQKKLCIQEPNTVGCTEICI